MLQTDEPAIRAAQGVEHAPLATRASDRRRSEPDAQDRRERDRLESERCAPAADRGGDGRRRKKCGRGTARKAGAGETECGMWLSRPVAAGGVPRGGPATW